MAHDLLVGGQVEYRALFVVGVEILLGVGVAWGPIHVLVVIRSLLVMLLDNNGLIDVITIEVILGHPVPNRTLLVNPLLVNSLLALVVIVRRFGVGLRVVVSFGIGEGVVRCSETVLAVTPEIHVLPVAFLRKLGCDLLVRARFHHRCVRLHRDQHVV